MDKWYDTIVESYEKTFGRWPKIVDEFNNLVKILDKMNERNMLDGENSWENKKEEFSTYSLKDRMLFYPKITTNLKIVNQQLEKAIEAYDTVVFEKNLFDDDQQETDNLKVEKLEQQVSQLINEINEANDCADKLKEENKTLNEKYESLNKEYKYIKIVCKEKDQALEDSEKQFKKIVLRLISLKEQLELFKTVYSGETGKMLLNLDIEIGSILKQVGIITKDEIDIKFDDTIHMIVDTQQTENVEKVDTVAKTISPGYVYNGVCLKEQKVIIYTQ